VFRTAWWTTNVLLALVFASLIYSAGWEYSVRQYLKGFSDAVVPAAASPEQKVEAILNWMRSGAPRPVAANPEEFSKRDPEATLNYEQLLAVCGTATNAFLNLSRSAGVAIVLVCAFVGSAIFRPLTLLFARGPQKITFEVNMLKALAA